MTTNKNTTNDVTLNSMKWDTAEIFEASFMFPTEHFETLDALQSTDVEVFTTMMIAMIELLPPLSDEEKQGLKKATLSGNRLRLYFQVLKLMDHYADSLAETQESYESLSTADTLERRGYQISSL